MKSIVTRVGTKFASPNSSITIKGTLFSTAVVSNHSIEPNWRAVTSGPRDGANAGTCAGRADGAASAGAWVADLRRQRQPLPVPVRLVRNSANDAPTRATPI